MRDIIAKKHFPSKIGFIYGPIKALMGVLKISYKLPTPVFECVSANENCLKKITNNDILS